MPAAPRSPKKTNPKSPAMPKSSPEPTVKWLDSGWFPFRFAFVPNEAEWDRLVQTELGMPLGHAPYPKDDDACVTTMQASVQATGRPTDLILFVTMTDHSDKTPIQITGMLAHEAVHVFQIMCQWIGEEEPSWEFEAYAVQNITMQLLEAFEECFPQKR